MPKKHKKETAPVKLKIKKGDKVVILAGRDKGKTGEVLKAIPTKNRLIVSGVNVVKKNQRPSATSAGGPITKELSIHASNVALADPKTGKPTRVGFKLLNDGSKTRVAKKSGEDIVAK